MTHDELLALLYAKSDSDEVHALRAVVELHKPVDEVPFCGICTWSYPCITIQAIKKELS